MNAIPLLSGRGLTKDYPMGAERVHALRRVDVDVYPGDFLALRGPSGSGKTTLIHLLGLLDVRTRACCWMSSCPPIRVRHHHLSTKHARRESPPLGVQGCVYSPPASASPTE